MGIEDLRRVYGRSALDRGDLAGSPLDQFSSWFELATETPKPDWFEVNAMTLATADASGRVSSRIVLLKKVSDAGFAFFTNYRSAKAAQLESNPNACLVFYWPHVEKQIRIEGLVSRTDDPTSDEYFHARPRGSQLGAVVSPQSEVIENREVLDTQREALDQKWQDAEIPRPDYWGGYVLRPVRYEFWQGRPDRLHDRFEYLWQENDWLVHRLAP